MLARIIDRILLRRHFWRHATFSEVAELYASRSMRVFAIRMFSAFISIYLLQEGFGVVFIALFWAGFYALRSILAPMSATLVGYFGPKRMTLVSNILSMSAMLVMPLVPEFGFLALLVWGLLEGVSTSIHDIAYLVNFSKVKSMKHAGKEMAFMNIVEKVAASLSPIAGGVMAFLAGPQSVMVVASALLLLAALPLFWTGEPTRVRQKLNFQGFPWRLTWRSMVAESAIGLDTVASSTGWTLFMGVVIFSTNSNDIYAKIGFLSSVAIVASLLSSYMFGKLIDRDRGGELLRFGVFANSITYIIRVFTTTPTGVATVNMLNEGAIAAFNMAFTRGMFDTADMSGRRIAYLSLMSMSLNIGCTIGALLLAGLFAAISSEVLVFQVFYGVMAIVTLLIATPRFALYSK